MIYLEDSVHYGVFWCPCDIMNIVVFIKKKCGQHVKTLICEDKIDFNILTAPSVITVIVSK